MIGFHQNKTILDTTHAAEYVGLSKSTMAKLRLSGDGAKYIKLGRKVAYRRSDLDAWLEANVRTSTSDSGSC